MYKSLSNRLTDIQSNLGMQETSQTDGGPQASRQVDTKDRTKAVLYSYSGVNTLPSSDILTNVLSKHPDVFFIDEPLRYRKLHY